MASKTKAARLVLGGAPESWHTVDGLPGHFHPSIPTPLDLPGLPSSDTVREFIRAHGKRTRDAAAEWERFRRQRIQDGRGDIGEFQAPPCPVELVDIDPKLAEEAAELVREQAKVGARRAAAARRAGHGDEINVQSETAALTGKE